jgi:hypothetical protein
MVSFESYLLKGEARDSQKTSFTIGKAETNTVAP